MKKATQVRDLILFAIKLTARVVVETITEKVVDEEATQKLIKKQEEMKAKVCPINFTLHQH